MSVELKPLLGIFSEIRFDYFALYIILGFLTIGVSVWKWLVLCRELGIHSSLKTLYGMYLSGMFYSQFFPTSVGGDVFRGIELHRSNNTDLETCYATIFAERFSGITVLVIFVLVVLPIDTRLYTNLYVLLSVALMSLTYVVGVWLIFHRTAIMFIKKRIRWNPAALLLEKVIRFRESLFHYKGCPKTIVMTVALSMLFYMLTVIVTGVGLKALHQDVCPYNLVLAVPIMLMLFLIPISLGGIGLQEWAHTFVFSLFGLSSVSGLSLGLLFRMRTVFFGLLGGMVVIVKYSIAVMKSGSSAKNQHMNNKQKP